MHPLIYPEYGKGPSAKKLWTQSLLFGGLPSIVNSTNAQSDLEDYVGLYLKEEILAEGVTRSIDNFSRFLTTAAFTSTEQINFTKIGNDAQIAPSTVREYYEILNDTLVGKMLPAFRETKKRKAITTSKFYFFDCGVANALIGRNNLVPSTPEYGRLLEHAIFIELRAYLDYRRNHKKLEFWRSTSQFEVDFLVYSDLKEIVAIEVKSSAHPSRSDYKGILALEEEFKLVRKIVVCQADRSRKTEDSIEIMPIFDFLDQLWAGQIV